MNKKPLKHTLKKQSSKNNGVISKAVISDRDRLIIDNYMETYNKSRSVMDVIPELKHQSQGNHIFESVWKRPEVQVYVRERRAYLTSQRPGLTPYEVANELMYRAYSDITPIIQCTTHEQLAELPAQDRRLIQNVKITERTETDRKGNEATIRTFDFKFVDKTDATKEYMKLTGMYALDNAQKSSGLTMADLPKELRIALTKALIKIQHDKGIIIDV